MDSSLRQGNLDDQLQGGVQRIRAGSRIAASPLPCNPRWATDKIPRLTRQSVDHGFLNRALELAEGGRGRVSPNPLVGAVLVRDRQVIGEGFHADLGGLHAERAALADCRARGEDATGATMYVTLEPCAHHGRQPPCVDAILESGLSRVVIASEDPSEKAAGRGPGMLRDGGVAVEFAAGAEAASARLLNQAFRKHARTGTAAGHPEAGDVARRSDRDRAR